LLVFGWGNASRGDDALGPLFIEQLSALAAADPASAGRIEFLDDYQLQVEHALDLVDRERVLFVDASLTCSAPFEVTQLAPSRDATFTTHAMSPTSVMQVYRDLQKAEPPPCTLLAIRGTRFELGEPPSPAALDHLAAAVEWARHWLDLGPP
jgi:hydrogenase maturation protease